MITLAREEFRRDPKWLRHVAKTPQRQAESSAVEKLISIASCDYRVPLARLRAEGSDGINGCGCNVTAVCLAGRGHRGMVGRECHACPLAGPAH